MGRKYSRKADSKESARAYGTELPISHKAAVEICRTIRNMDLEGAKTLLKDVMDKKRAIKFRRYAGSAGHRRGKMGPGRYPVKAAKHILMVLENAEANAQFKGLSSEDMYIWHISAYKGMTYESYFPRAHGRTTPKNRETVNLEVILKLRE